MATEYYIVKPATKQVFYLGKRISCLDGINNWQYKQQASWPEWECFEDIVFDIQENARYFLEGYSDATVGQIWDFANAIYEFCDNAVYLDNDCSDNFVNWNFLLSHFQFFFEESSVAEIMPNSKRKNGPNSGISILFFLGFVCFLFYLY